MRRGMVSLLLVTALGLSLLLSGCGTQVPDLKGKTAQQAEQALREAGFNLGKVTYDEKAEGARGAVVSQEPAASKRVSADSIINVVVAGPPPVAVPKVLGLTKAEAASALTALGLALGEVAERYDASAPTGSLTSQTPVAGAEVPRGSIVDITVSKGREPVAVPDVTKKNVDDAKKLLSGAGFKVQTLDEYNSASRGTVVSQQPKAGTKVQPGGTIKLVVSRGEELVRVPNVLSAVRNHSWRGSYDEDPSAVAQEVINFVEDYIATKGLRGKCVLQQIEQTDYQKPKAGTMVPKGTLVTVYVAFGD